MLYINRLKFPLAEIVAFEKFKSLSFPRTNVDDNPFIQNERWFDNFLSFFCWEKFLGYERNRVVSAFESSRKSRQLRGRIGCHSRERQAMGAMS